MIKYFIGVCFIFLVFASCKKENADFTLEPATDYFPLQIGKYITYDLDSTVFTNFGQDKTIRHYQAQYRIDAQITDNSQRTGFTINRFLRKDSTQPWQIDNVFTAFPTSNSIELIQDNLRFIKLILPIKEGFSWKGNSYLPFDPYRSYVFANPAFTEDWNYIYEDVNAPTTIGSNNFDNTITVFEVNDSTGDPKTTEYAEKTFGIEKYAKNVGLIYKDFIHWEYQAGDNTYKGFGETLSIIDHN
ncbi:MAG: hypothetical protein ABIR50_07985 [Ginsengibacter sp.]